MLVKKVFQHLKNNTWFTQNQWFLTKKCMNFPENFIGTQILFGTRFQVSTTICRSVEVIPEIESYKCRQTLKNEANLWYSALWFLTFLLLVPVPPTFLMSDYFCSTLPLTGKIASFPFFIPCSSARYWFYFSKL